jgi:hypothetical protein
MNLPFLLRAIGTTVNREIQSSILHSCSESAIILSVLGPKAGVNGYFLLLKVVHGNASYGAARRN